MSQLSLQSMKTISNENVHNSSCIPLIWMFLLVLFVYAKTFKYKNDKFPPFFFFSNEYINQKLLFSFEVIFLLLQFSLHASVTILKWQWNLYLKLKYVIRFYKIFIKFSFYNNNSIHLIKFIYFYLPINNSMHKNIK